MGHAADRCAAVNVAQLRSPLSTTHEGSDGGDGSLNHTTTRSLNLRHVCTRKILSASKPVIGHREDCIWVGITEEDGLDDTFKFKVQSEATPRNLISIHWSRPYLYELYTLGTYR